MLNKVEEARICVSGEEFPYPECFVPSYLNALGYRRFAPMALGSLLSYKMTTFHNLFFAQKQPNRQENRSGVRLNGDNTDRVLSTTLINQVYG
jgi:hypothetical protein